MPRNRQVSALAWAADQAGESYGKLMLTLTEARKQEIYAEYQAHLDEMKESAAALPVNAGKSKQPPAPPSPEVKAGA